MARARGALGSNRSFGLRMIGSCCVRPGWGSHSHSLHCASTASTALAARHCSAILFTALLHRFARLSQPLFYNTRPFLYFSRCCRCIFGSFSRASRAVYVCSGGRRPDFLDFLILLDPLLFSTLSHIGAITFFAVFRALRARELSKRCVIFSAQQRCRRHWAVFRANLASVLDLLFFSTI
jgi:hypothetical protein